MHPTHVIQASIRLGLIAGEQAIKSDARQIDVSQWKDLLDGTELQFIDVYTPLWRWSRGKFVVDI